jgi:hypothetical protein
MLSRWTSSEKQACRIQVCCASGSTYSALHQELLIDLLLLVATRVRPTGGSQCQFASYLWFDSASGDYINTACWVRSIGKTPLQIVVPDVF